MGGGGSKSNLTIESKIWIPKIYHENKTSIMEKQLSSVSRETGELFSIGITNSMVTSDFDYLNDKDTFYRLKRKGYIESIEECCTTNISYFKFINTIACNLSYDTRNDTLCDDYLYDQCIEQDKNDDYCLVWVESAVYKSYNRLMDMVIFFSKDDKFNTLKSNRFIYSLRKYQNNSNNYNSLADSILNSYSSDIKKNLLCAFPPEDIIEQSKKIYDLPKECWYKECSLTSLDRLLTSNINNLKKCQITICDININNINISSNNIQIICKNKFNNNKIDIINNPINIDKESLFFIPTFINTIIPLIFVSSLVFIK